MHASASPCHLESQHSALVCTAWGSLHSSRWWTSICWLQVYTASSHPCFLCLSHQPCLLACLLKTLTADVNLHLIASFVDNSHSLLTLNLIWAFSYSANIYWKPGECQECNKHWESWRSTSIFDMLTWHLKRIVEQSSSIYLHIQRDLNAPKFGHIMESIWTEMWWWKNWTSSQLSVSKCFTV